MVRTRKSGVGPGPPPPWSLPGDNTEGMQPAGSDSVDSPRKSEEGRETGLFPWPWSLSHTYRHTGLSHSPLGRNKSASATQSKHRPQGPDLPGPSQAPGRQDRAFRTEGAARGLLGQNGPSLRGTRTPCSQDRAQAADGMVSGPLCSWLLLLSPSLPSPPLACLPGQMPGLGPDSMHRPMCPLTASVPYMGAPGAPHVRQGSSFWAPLILEGQAHVSAGKPARSNNKLSLPPGVGTGVTGRASTPASLCGAPLLLRAAPPPLLPREAGNSLCLPQASSARSRPIPGPTAFGSRKGRRL